MEEGTNGLQSLLISRGCQYENLTIAKGPNWSRSVYNGCPSQPHPPLRGEKEALKIQLILQLWAYDGSLPLSAVRPLVIIS